MGEQKLLSFVGADHSLIGSNDFGKIVIPISGEDHRMTISSPKVKYIVAYHDWQDYVVIWR